MDVDCPRSDSVADVDKVRDEIVRVCDNDRTIESQALAIAQYLLHTKRLPVNRVLRRLSKSSAARYVRQLLDVETDFLSVMPRTLGPDIVSFILAGRIQKSLDVKHFDKNAGAASSVAQDVALAGVTTTNRIIPTIKPIILYAHPTKIWIRFRLPLPLSGPVPNVFHISDNVYEKYLEKSRDCPSLATIARLESEHAADIIFCSELSLFLNDKLLFISNYVKFMYCYTTDSPIFDPRTHLELKYVSIYLTYSLLFLNTSNLTTMRPNTHNPLIAYTGERPKLALSKCSTSTIYNVEGSRAMQSMDLGSDFGMKSNFVEVIAEVELNDECLDTII